MADDYIHTRSTVGSRARRTVDCRRRDDPSSVRATVAASCAPIHPLRLPRWEDSNQVAWVFPGPYGTALIGNSRDSLIALDFCLNELTVSSRRSVSPVGSRRSPSSGSRGD